VRAAQARRRRAPHRHQAAGVDEVAIVAAPARDESRVTAWVEDLANEWVRPAEILA